MILRRLTLTLLFFGLTADNLPERAFTGEWRSPLAGIGGFLFDNLNKATGIDALRFSGLDVLLALLLFAVLLEQRRRPVAGALNAALLLTFFSLVWLEIWGMARGGNFKSSLWQLRQMIWLPGVTLIFAGVFGAGGRGAGVVGADLRAAGKVIVFAAATKVALGAYFVWFIAPGLETEPAFATTHSDSVLFVTALFILIANALHRGTVRSLWQCILGAPWILFGLVINNRRLAFVSLFAGLFLVYRLLRGERRRLITRAGIGLVPFVLVYVIAGRNHGDTAVFKPAAALASVFMQKDRSSGTRDVENYNLIQTLKQHPLMGSGFGHEYVEAVHADDISRDFALYRYIGHNSVLWLWSVAGLFAFVCLWLFLSVGAFFATRAYAFSRGPSERTAAAVSLAVILAYILQAYGDMGVQSWIGVFLLGLALATVGRLAVVTGAVREPLRRNLGQQRRRPGQAVTVDAAPPVMS